MPGRGESRVRLARAMNYVVERIGVQMDQLRADLTYQIANAAQLAAEERRPRS